MARIQVACPKCGKNVPIIRETITRKGNIVRKWKCGHSKVFKKVSQIVPEGEKPVCKTCECEITPENENEHSTHELSSIPLNRDPAWLRLYKYQQKGVEFIEESQFKCLNADEMGLGKTAQALMTLRYNYEELTPVLIISPAGHIHNWYRECQKWINDKYNEFKDTPIVHIANTPLLKGMRVVIISNMMISKKAIKKSIEEYGFKTVIIDESHHFKNDNSKRTSTLINLAKSIPYRILLSGTSVLNRTTEYFNTLHLCNEYHWRNKGDLARMCIRDRRGRLLSIAPYWKDTFNERTSKYVIRRTKKELFRELPPITIEKHYVDLQDNPVFVEAYNQKLDELERLLNTKKGNMQEGAFMEVIAIIQQLWEYTSIAKVKHVVTQAQEFLENTENNGESPKLTLGGHHRIARKKIGEFLSEYNPVYITDQDAREKDEMQFLFKDNSDRRLCIASLLGAGEGRNLDFCHNVIIYERYWNPAKEAQFIGRFWARGLNPDINTEGYEPVSINYILAIDTIDEFFTKTLQLKWNIVESALNKNYSADPNFIYNLANDVVQTRLKYTGGL